MLLYSIGSLGSIPMAIISFYGAWRAWEWPIWGAAFFAFPFVIRVSGNRRVLQFLQPAEHATPRPVHSITVDVAAVVRAGARMARRMDAIHGRAGRVNARGAGREDRSGADRGE